ncbi:hypothetical protein LMH87_001314 [Akanthomyces muscarius]|uniref:Alpha/beta hydrolase fold-3 domain-containing protein n=1 Tax=Akanthomyces muscarius TaxID=2231603 RepID=A0A9W8QGT8_AKAMU|nr:hypothetical protein LMH87_001314 [Akanthomyces muscarius]KAJ4156100.1 hypothetical protein LMH87_001314 [Akanthomyces muscarius]
MMSSLLLADAWVQVERAIGQRPQLTGDALAMRAQYKAVNDEVNANLVRSTEVAVEDEILDGNLRICLLLAERLPCVIVSVDYRLAPEHKAPTQLDDAIHAWTWAYNNATNLNGDCDKYFAIGQSAGGSLALSVVRQLVVLKRKHEIKGVAAIVPFTIHPNAVPRRFLDSYRSYNELKNSPVNTREAMDVFYDAIGALETDPDVYIINAVANFHQFPPTYLVVCEMDPLRDDGLILNDALQSSGKDGFLQRFTPCLLGF